MSKSIREMFSRVAASYDLNNRILSFGIDQTWRKRAVEASGAKPGSRVLDCACGTGDLTLAFKEAVGDQGEVIGTDFCPDMLAFAPFKASREGLSITFEVQDVTALTYDDNSFDIASIAFGIRNVDDPVLALKEMARVVKPGGRVVILEFGQPNGLIRPFYQFYSKKILPKLGGWISGDEEAYRYLQRSSSKFPCGVDFIKLIIQTDAYKLSRFEKLSGGICYLYVAQVR